MKSIAEECYRHCREFDLVIDSRRVIDPAATLFCALAGRRHDGHDFLVGLYHRGVRHFVISRPEFVKGDRMPEATLYLVDDVPALMLLLAAQRRRAFRGKVIAITGSNGKTMVKDWLVQILSTRGRVIASPRSFNSRIGVALSVWQLSAGYEYAVFELGISEAGDAEKLAGVVEPDLGVLTNIGSAHDAGFPDRSTKIREKLDLLRGSILILPDDPQIDARLTADDIVVTRWMPYGVSGIRIDKRTIEYPLPLQSAVEVYNGRVVMAVLHTLFPKAVSFREEMSELRPLANRLEQRAGRDGGIIINDSYSNDLDALAAAIDYAEMQDGHGRLTLILGDIQPADGLAGKLHQLLEGRVDRLITVGPDADALTAGFRNRENYASVAELLKWSDHLELGGQTTLVKGSSRQQLSRLVDRIARGRHRTVLETDLRAIRHNYSVYAGLVPRDVKKIVMVKASAYGGGLLPVARALVAAGADYLAVAYPGEGATLRAGGLTGPIMVLNVDEQELDVCQQHRLEPVVYSDNILHRVLPLRLRVHLEIDTGMGRLGFPPAELPRLRNAFADPTRIASVFTHLSGSEDEGLDGYTYEQLLTFSDACERAWPSPEQRPPRHALNSNGISRFPEYAFEMVRLGIGLFGIGDAKLAGRLTPATRLTAQVTAVRRYPAGTCIGYNLRGKLKADATIAVLSIGYADGLPRLAGEGRFFVLIAGYRCATVGAICMDMCMVDVTDIPRVRPGTEAVIFGPEHPVDVLAAAARTIPYEILTGVGERVHRVYLGE